MIKFALIGAAGYIAPRHMQAIKEVGGELVAALDPHDSVGILDSYFPDCLYFKEPERFDRFLSKHPVDYVSICSPNYLHDSHALMAMRNGADVICEKPLVCNERNLDNLAEWEVKTGAKVNAILQCRLHPEAIKAKERITIDKTYSCEISYQTPRGPWYDFSWKQDIEKSGGLPTNIGVHLFDLCHWFFGATHKVNWAKVSKHLAFGRVTFELGFAEWQLSIRDGNRDRSFFIQDNTDGCWNVNLTNGFTDLHTESYRKILAGEGFGIEDARPAIRIVEWIRNANQY